MKFHEFSTLYQSARRNRLSQGITAKEFYRSVLQSAEQRAQVNNRDIDPATLVRVAIGEAAWYELERPYYSIWPAMLAGLAKLKIEHVPVESLGLPFFSLLLRFPVGEEPRVGPLVLRCLLVSDYRMRAHTPQSANRELWIGVDYLNTLLHGHLDEEELRYVAMTVSVLGGGLSLADALNESNASTVDPSMVLGINLSEGRGEKLVISMMQLAVRITASVCLLAKDPDLIEPDVLDKDRGKFAHTSDPDEIQKMVERAHRRGKVGWNVGARLEVSPHYRRAHFGIRWTGQGRTIPKVVPIKGCVVRRKHMTEVPTGYLDREVKHESDL